MARTLKRITADKRVEVVDDERDAGNGVLVTLKRGWSWDALADNRVRGEDTASAMLAAMREAKPFAGPYTD